MTEGEAISIRQWTQPHTRHSGLGDLPPQKTPCTARECEKEIRDTGNNAELRAGRSGF